MLTREIASRKIIDFIVLRVGEKYLLGATFYVPDARQFQVRSNERPVVSSQNLHLLKAREAPAEPERGAERRCHFGPLLWFRYDTLGSGHGRRALHRGRQGQEPRREQQAEPGVALKDPEDLKPSYTR